MLSELKTAFLIGFQIYLPFVILDIVVASVTISMGMLMLPPVLDFAAVQAAAVCAGRRLAPGGGNAAGKLSRSRVVERKPADDRMPLASSDQL